MRLHLLPIPLLFLVSVTVAGVAAADPPAAPTDDEGARIYSPYAIELTGPGSFDVITFEDVGMHLADKAQALLLYEAISQGVAFDIERSAHLSYTTRPVYRPELTQPNQHIYCDEQHLYVALWRGSSPHRWGYSLWSGCGAEDRFAWQEVPAPYDATTPWHELVEPLTRALVESLERAQRSNCLQLHC